MLWILQRSKCQESTCIIRSGIFNLKFRCVQQIHSVQGMVSDLLPSLLFRFWREMVRSLPTMINRDRKNLHFSCDRVAATGLVKNHETLMQLSHFFDQLSRSIDWHAVLMMNHSSGDEMSKFARSPISPGWTSVLNSAKIQGISWLYGDWCIALVSPMLS